MKKIKLTPEQKAKIKNLAKTQLQKKFGTTPTKKTTKSKTPIVKEEIKPAKNFWKDEIDLKFMKVNGLQLVIGSTVLIGGAALAIKKSK